MVVQWLRLRAPNAGGLGSIRGQGTRSHMPQLKILHATMKTEDPKYCNLRPSAAKQITINELKQFLSSQVMTFRTLPRFL